MSKKTPTNTPAFKCHSHFHMTMAEHALYDIAMAWTDHGKKPFFFDGPKLARQFSEGSKNNMYWLEASLVRKGWLVLEVEKSRRTNGHWSSRTYTALTHDGWRAAVGAKYYDRDLKEVLPRFPDTCPELDGEGVIKGLPVHPEVTAHRDRLKKPSTARGNGPVQPESPASPAREPSQSSQREKANPYLSP
jgi:hypothetical protein